MSKRDETFKRLDSLYILESHLKPPPWWSRKRKRYRNSISALLRLRFFLKPGGRSECTNCLSSEMHMLEGSSDQESEKKFGIVLAYNQPEICFCPVCWTLAYYESSRVTALQKFFKPMRDFEEVLDSLEKLNENPMKNIFHLRTDFEGATFRPPTPALPLATVEEPKQLKTTL